MEKTMIQTEEKNQCIKAPAKKSNPVTQGLDDTAVQLSREKHGSNNLTKQKRAGFLSQFLQNLNDPIIRILLAAMLLNMVFLFPDIDWYECGGIGIAVCIATLVSTISEYGSGRAFDKMYADLGDCSSTVLRNGVWCSVSAGELVCLDVIRLRQGDIIPVDGLVLSGQIEVDEASLTGESLPVQKNATDLPLNMTLGNLPRAVLGDSTAVFRGSVVSAGNCTILAVCVGDKTVYGQAASELQTADSPSPLKERLRKLAKNISTIGYISAAFVAAAHLFHAFYLESGMNLTVMWLRMQDLRFVWSECLAAMTMAISILVVAVPEGLPMMITVILSSNMKKMLNSGVLVRKMVGIETAGCLSILFTDKTGTLTTGALSVSEFRTVKDCYTLHKDIPGTFLETLRIGISACGGTANPTELAISKFLAVTDKQPTYAADEKVPFDSAKKFSAGKYRNTGYILGAPEYLLSHCSTWILPNGTTQILDAHMRENLLHTLQQAASHGARILLQAQFSGDLFPHLKRNGLDTLPLTFLGFWVLQDEIRDEVPKSVHECRTAGIQVVMITGDNEWTASSIAQRTGILSENWQFYGSALPVPYGTELVLRGQDLRLLSDDALKQLLPSVRVISRVTPTDKSRLIHVAKSIGHVVGMTGDGVNDAPALKSADVGFAMGSGTDVAREAGDIIITDDNFISIGKAVLFGRTIFQSIRKFIVFQLIMNLSAVGVSLLGPLVGIEHPVTVTQMLWVNIIMDTLGSLAFAGEAPRSEYLLLPPLSRNEPILNWHMIKQVLLSAGFMILLCMGFLTSQWTRYLLGKGDLSYFLTAFFALFVFCGISFAFTVRTSHINFLSGLTKNKAFLIIMPVVAFVQLLIIYFGGEIFHTVPLDSSALWICGLLALTILPVDALRKWTFRQRKTPK